MYAYGRGRPHAQARVELYGGTWIVDVDAEGWWLVVADAPEEAFEAAMEAADARFRWIKAMSTSQDAPSGAFGSTLFVTYERPEEPPSGLQDVFRTPLRVTIE